MPEAGRRSSHRSIPANQAECRQGPSPKEWEDVKSVVRQLYLVEHRSLKEVQATLETEYSFRASERMFKTRLARWHFSKNSTDKDWKVLAVLLKHREDEAKHISEFMVHDRKKSPADIRRHIKTKNTSEEAFLADAWHIPVPFYIRCYTPDSAEPRRPASQGSSEGFEDPLFTPSSSGSPPKLPPATFAQDPLQTLPQRHPSHSFFGRSDEEGCAAFTDQNDESAVIDSSPEVVSISRSVSHSDSELCDHFKEYLHGISIRALTPDSAGSQDPDHDAQSWVVIYKKSETDHEAHCAKCGQSVNAHPYVPDDSSFPAPVQRRLFGPSSAGLGHTEFEHDLKIVLPWMSACFAACLHRKNEVLVATSLANAKALLQRMLLNKNAMLLTGLNHMLSLLHMHLQGCVAESVMNAALEVAESSLEPLDPVRVTIQWMTAASGQKIEQSGVTSQTLRKVLQMFMVAHGPDHPHTLTSMYNLSFQLLLDGIVNEPQSLLRQLFEKSKILLGPSSMQTITALTTLSRAQSNEGHHQTAIETMKLAIASSEATFRPDLDHPFRLESKRRLAQLYEKFGQKAMMEPLYWEVLVGRIKMLGKHSYTFGAKRDLTQLLKDLGKWDSEGLMEKRVSDLFYPGYENGAGVASF